MTELTPGYSLPSPVDAEAPNGPAQIKALAEAVETALGTLLPTGTIVATARSTAPNEKWLIAEGQAVSRTTYATLFAAIGTTYGAGNGSTTFNLPNLKGRVPLGAGTPPNAGEGTTAHALAAVGGEQNHTLTEAEIPSHSHVTDNIVMLHQEGVAGGRHPEEAGGGTSTQHTRATGGGGAHNNLPPYLAVNYMIKT